MKNVYKLFLCFVVGLSLISLYGGFSETHALANPIPLEQVEKKVNRLEESLTNKISKLEKDLDNKFLLDKDHVERLFEVSKQRSSVLNSYFVIFTWAISLLYIGAVAVIALGRREINRTIETNVEIQFRHLKLKEFNKKIAYFSNMLGVMYYQFGHFALAIHNTKRALDYVIESKSISPVAEDEEMRYVEAKIKSNLSYYYALRKLPGMREKAVDFAKEARDYAIEKHELDMIDNYLFVMKEYGIDDISEQREWKEIFDRYSGELKGFLKEEVKPLDLGAIFSEYEAFSKEIEKTQMD